MAIRKKNFSATFRPEIQGLRAIAVVCVLVFHTWPETLPGGYIGVDVFFVISGYLITDLLLREVKSSEQINLIRFYQRRIKRLFPAAILVIIFSALCIPVLPQSQWIYIYKDIIASILYLQNWFLYDQAVNYLSQEDTPRILQHYWSLSVEEQYYLVWPLIIYLIVYFTNIFRAKLERYLFIIIILLGGMSFLYSVYLVIYDSALAYFSTMSRAWEFCVGGIIATSSGFSKVIPSSIRVILGWFGLAMIVLACTQFDSETQFPGYAAALPAVGAALVISSPQKPKKWSSYSLLHLRPLQYLGDISYSLYLWHWPIIIVYKTSLGGEPGSIIQDVAIVFVAVLVAWLTKVWVEDPFRHGKTIRTVMLESPRLMFMALISLGMAILINFAIFDYIKTEAPVVNISLLKQKYDPSQPTVPSVLRARNDIPDVYKLKCHVDQISSEPLSCSFGPASAKHLLAVIGDSHAAQWIPALREIYSKKPDWRIITFTKSACAFNEQDITIGKERRPYHSCSEWNTRVLAEINKIQPEIVVFSASSTYRVIGIENGGRNLEALKSGLLVRWNQLRSSGAKVVVIRDTPRMDRDVPKCMSNLGVQIEDCSTPLERALRPDPIVEAMRTKPNVTYVDLTSEICIEKKCLPVMGQILTYRDSHHLTATFVRLLANKIAPYLAAIVE